MESDKVSADVLIENIETMLSRVGFDDPLKVKELEGVMSQLQKLRGGSFSVNPDEETGSMIISGMGELHLEILVDR